ncbi:PDC sensor domain-containing protein [Roseibium aggregatum]|uniref:PDC sensor domain-containing protein n=1 Tax=Roseibium aggregatum TaxID=187304 RepID=UPI0025ABFD26|nr:histidine kinase [Roseibium aggregatum]WJS05170.1 histidine kinase [Roseibium aggregatum]
MVRFVSVLMSLFLLAGSALAQNDTEISETEFLVSDTVRSARTNQLAAERVLFATEQAIDAASFIVSSIKVDRLIHVELKRLASRVPGVRAIIVVGPDGQLLHDSYKFPAVQLDLSDRSYFKKAIASSNLIIGEQVVGRTSGSSFVPVVKRIGSLTFVAVTAPYALVELQSECGDCWSVALQDDGEIVAMFPPDTTFLRDLIVRMSPNMRANGSRVVRYEHSIFSVVWRKSPDFPIVSVSVRGLPDTASVDIDVN